MNASDEELLSDLLIDWEESLERGVELSPDDLCAGCLHLKEEIARRIKALKDVSWLDHPSITPTGELPVADSPRTVAGRYRLIAPSGEGGHATVWKGFDERLLRDVAVKSPKPLNSQESLLHEARVLARLRHPNILPVMDVVEDGDDCLIVSEWVDGGNLASIHTPVSVPTAVDLVRRIADALAYAHSQGILHRDIKPANILLTASGTPLLADFGIAASLETSKVKQGGTVWYCSPEALQGMPVDERSEVYSLGLVLFGLLTGRVPHESHDPLKMQQEVVGSVDDAQGIPPALRAICKKALDPDPSKRFATAQELSDALGAPQKAPSLWRRALPFASVLITALLIVAGFVSNGMRSPEATTSGPPTPPPRRKNGPTPAHMLIDGLPQPLLYLSCDSNVSTIPETPSFTRNEGVQVPGKLGQGHRFDGTTYSQIDLVLPEGDANRTLAAWIKSENESKTGDRSIVCYGALERARLFGIKEVEGKWRFVDLMGGLPSGVPTIDTKWHHHAVSYDGTTIRYYFDGVHVAATERGLATADGPLYLGGPIDGTFAQGFMGIIDEVYVFDTFLSPRQVQALALGSKVSVLPALVPPPPPSPEQQKNAVQLIHTTDLRGWRPREGANTASWSVQDGELALTKSGPGGQSLISDQKFYNFDMHLEFLLPPGADSGVFLRGRYEVQLRDSEYIDRHGLPAPPVGSTGAIHGLLEPTRMPYKGPNQWNSLDVTLIGQDVTVRINGEIVIARKRIDGLTGGAFDDRQPQPGPFLIQSDTKTPGLRFRNFVVTPR